MNIVLVVDNIAVSCGGPALDTLLLAQHLAHRFGHITRIVTWSAPGLRLPTRNLEVHEFPRPRSPVGLVRMARQLRALFVRADAIFVSGLWGPTDGLLMRLLWPKRVPVYIRTCGMLEPYILQRHQTRKLLGRIGYVSANLRNAAGVIVASTPEAQRVASLGVSERIMVIRNCVPEPTRDTAPATPRRSGPANVRRLLYLGRIHPKKGLHRLLEALRDFASDEIQLHLTVAGPWSDPDYRKCIEQLAAHPAVSSRATFLGEVTGAAKESAFGGADLFILPSDSEGLPNAVLEALARGLPCIITEGCNIPEITSYSAGLVVSPDAAGMQQALGWASAAKFPWSNLSANALELSRAVFSFDAALMSYHSLVSGQPA